MYSTSISFRSYAQYYRAEVSKPDEYDFSLLRSTSIRFHKQYKKKKVTGEFRDAQLEWYVSAVRMKQNHPFNNRPFHSFAEAHIHESVNKNKTLYTMNLCSKWLSN